MKRIDREKNTVKAMIEMYCKKFHKPNPGKTCARCDELYEYSAGKLEKCPFGNEKPVCKKCAVHCYNNEKRKQIKKVMKYAGPRMIFRHPKPALLHFFGK